MRASDDGRLCLEAEVYYYDLLCQQDVTVPQSVREHVKACPACQGQIRRLQGILSEAEKGDDSAGSSADDEMVEALARQFGLLDEQVTCSHVKSFLPSLLDPARAIRIPTPVTVHLDHCPQRIEALAAIRALNLTAEQLKRLGRLFEPPDLRESQKCRRARPAVAALGSFSLADAGAEALSHVSTCPACRAQGYRERERHRH